MAIRRQEATSTAHQLIDSPGPYDTVAASDSSLTCIELFAGPGGLALGSHFAGFQHLALIEFEANAALTLRRNALHLFDVDPDTVVERDVREIDFSSYTGRVDLLTAGPPCQPFSGGGRGKGADDERNMFPALLAAIAAVRPRAILIENVQGLTREKFKDYFAYIRRYLELPLLGLLPHETWLAHFRRLNSANDSNYCAEQRYRVGFQIVDAADYGIPQRRHRVFIVAFRQDTGIAPFSLLPTHGKAALLAAQQQGVYWTRHGLPVPATHNARTALLDNLSRAPWRTVRDAIADLPEPVLRGEPEQISNHVQHPGARSYRGHAGSELDWPAKALKAGAHGTPGGENMLQMPDGTVRYLTVREAARLQTFPDNWVFCGRWGACIRQLGNAVPVELATKFAAEIRDHLASATESGNQPSSLDVLKTALEAS